MTVTDWHFLPVDLFGPLVSAERGKRHAGHGHQPVPTGHVKANHARARRVHKLAFVAAADRLEAHVHAELAGVVAKQEKRTLAGLKGSRGRQIRRTLRAGTRADDTTPPPQEPAPPPDASAIFDTAGFTTEIANILQAFYQHAEDEARQRITDQLGRHLPEGVPSNATAADNLVARANRLAGNVANDTFTKIQQALADGVTNGDTVGQLADAVRHVFDVARSRAELIARTETTSALNQATHDYANALPPGSVDRKEWLAIHDERTRMTHRVADGQTVPLGMPFIVGGFPMQFPGDPVAPPDLVCNCRCSVLYHPGPLAQPAQEVAA